MGRGFGRGTDYNSGLDELGGMIDNAAKARQLEEEELRKREAVNIALKQKQLALDAQGMAEEKPTLGETNLDTYGTTDEATIRGKKASGGIYEDPKTLGLRMRDDPDAVRAELEAQASAGEATAGAAEHLYEGVGPGGERAFSNKKALAHKSGFTDVKEYDRSGGNGTGGGGGTFSVIGGGGGREQANKDKATALLRRLEATPPNAPTSDETMRSFLENKDFYAGIAKERGAEEAEATMTSDALDGKLPMRAVGPLSRMFATEVREYGKGYGSGLPPNLEAAVAEKEEAARMATVAAEKKKADDLTALRDVVEESSPGGSLRPAVDTARGLASSDEPNERGQAADEQEYLDTRGEPTPGSRGSEPNVRATPSPEDRPLSKRQREERRAKSRKDAEKLLARRAREARGER